MRIIFTSFTEDLLAEATILAAKPSNSDNTYGIDKKIMEAVKSAQK